jgi:nucleotide-binding universal stress UspA family protein
LEDDMPASPNGATSRIVAAVDGSAPSVAALRWAVRQAELTDGSVDAVIAWQFPLAAGGLGWSPVGAVDDTDYSALAAQSLADAVASVTVPAGVVVRQVVVDGNAHQAILEAAKDAALVVVGNRGHGGLTDALIGSVSTQVLHHAPCPVVVLHATHA